MKKLFRKGLLIFGIMVVICLNVFAQINSYQFEQLDSLQKVESRNVVVFIHTDWCKYCKAMLQTTFKNKTIQHTLNDLFYFIQLNAEERRNISFNGRAFPYLPNGNNTGSNTLALELANISGEVNYPTITFLNPENEIIFQHSGFMTSEELGKIMKKLY